MQITKLVAENILKLQAIHITPQSSTIEIKGDNGAGKSSILDAILIGLKGKKFSPPEPVKHGEKKGKIVIDMDGDSAAGLPPFTITSKVTNNKIETIIEPSELLNGETPRQFLDKLLGAISFDPWEFVGKDSAKQKQILLELIGVDIDKIDKREKKIFDERTIVGRDLKAAEARVKGLVFHEIEETEEVKVSELSQKLTDAIEFNNDYAQREENNQRLKESAIRDKEEIERLKQRIEELEKGVVQKRENYKCEKEELEKMRLIDLNSLKQDIAKIDEKNAMIRDNKRYDEEKGKLDDLRDTYGKLDIDLESIRQERINALQSANIPVEGLSFSDDGLLYNDIPLSQCSDGEKLMISMRISMALNPTVKILRVKDGSLIGPKNLEILKEIVKDKGYQLWLESVSGRDEYENGGKTGIFISEGIAEGEGVEEVKRGESKKKASKGKEDEQKKEGKYQEQSSESSKKLKEEVEEMNVSNDNNNKNEINDEDDDW
jgi:hypothetical protein